MICLSSQTEAEAAEHGLSKLGLVSETSRRESTGRRL